MKKTTIGTVILTAFLLISLVAFGYSYNEYSELEDVVVELEDVIEWQEHIMETSKDIPKVQCNGETWYIEGDDGYLHEYTMIRTTDNKEGYLGECI